MSIGFAQHFLVVLDFEPHLSIGLCLRETEQQLEHLGIIDDITQVTVEAKRRL